MSRPTCRSEEKSFIDEKTTRKKEEPKILWGRVDKPHAAVPFHKGAFVKNKHFYTVHVVIAGSRKGPLKRIKGVNYVFKAALLPPRLNTERRFSRKNGCGEALQLRYRVKGKIIGILQP
ncbi:hypothetical protein Trydic_g7484 [Trypoxylus dichotomus]